MENKNIPQGTGERSLLKTVSDELLKRINAYSDAEPANIIQTANNDGQLYGLSEARNIINIALATPPQGTVSDRGEQLGNDAIKFANWLRDNAIYDGAPKPMYRADMLRKTTEELYNIYQSLSTPISEYNLKEDLVAEASKKVINEKKD